MPKVSNENKKNKSIFSKIYFKMCLAIFTPLIGVWLGAYLQYHYSFLTQIEIANSQKKQQVYSQLMGIKIVRAQLYFSRFEALIYSDYYERRYQLLGSTEDFKECNRWMHRSEDLVVELSRNNKELFETIGFINVLFTQQTSSMN